MAKATRMFGFEYVQGYTAALQDVLSTFEHIQDDLKRFKQKQNYKTYKAIVETMLTNRVALRESPTAFIRFNSAGKFELFDSSSKKEKEPGAKIKRYTIKPDTTKETIISCGGKEGGTWINKESKFFISKCFEYKEIGFEFSIQLAFKDDVLDWNDFDNVLVLDEDFCQPYTPFYDDNYGKEATFPPLKYCIEQYNQFMDSLPFLTEIKEEHNEKDT